MVNSPFLYLGAGELAKLISQGTERVLYCAPGITQPIAALLANAGKRIGVGCLHVVLDVDDATARLGYGEFVDFSGSLSEVAVMGCDTF